MHSHTKVTCRLESNIEVDAKITGASTAYCNVTETDKIIHVSVEVMNEAGFNITFNNQGTVPMCSFMVKLLSLQTYIII